MSFTDQVVVVTGAAQGIGKSVAEAYAVAGAKVVLADVQEAEGAAAAASIRHEGGEAIFVHCDVRKEQDIRRLFETTVKEFKQIDILVNNAGVSRWKSAYELTVDEWDEVLNVNVRSCFLASREVARYMKKNEHGGAIVNMASTRAMMSEPNSEAYAASKGAITALTHAMAVSLGKDQIRVNCISPGWIETGDVSKLTDADHAQHPSGRVGVPSDISRACLYLSDPANTFVTGTNLVIDGGMTRKMIYED